MGQHADDFLDMVCDHEAFCDEYVSGLVSMEDAFEAGILDSTGCEVPELQAAYDRAYIPTVENIEVELERAVSNLERGWQRSAQTHTQQPTRAQVIAQARQANLAKERPTCNCCGELMQPRNGRYGKFYFCQCPEQVTVSDKYWQSVRIKK